MCQNASSQPKIIGIDGLFLQIEFYGFLFPTQDLQTILTFDTSYFEVLQGFK
jgi:hypothetical protein